MHSGNLCDAEANARVPKHWCVVVTIRPTTIACRTAPASAVQQARSVLWLGLNGGDVSRGVIGAKPVVTPFQNVAVPVGIARHTTQLLFRQYVNLSKIRSRREVAR